MSDCDHIDVAFNDDVDHAVGEALHFGDATKRDIHCFDESSSAPGVIFS
jgi:hypothetical protein